MAMTYLNETERKISNVKSAGGVDSEASMMSESVASDNTAIGEIWKSLSASNNNAQYKPLMNDKNSRKISKSLELMLPSELI